MKSHKNKIIMAGLVASLVIAHVAQADNREVPVRVISALTTLYGFRVMTNFQQKASFFKNTMRVPCGAALVGAGLVGFFYTNNVLRVADNIRHMIVKDIIK